MSLRRVTHDQDKMLRIIKKIAEKEGKARTGRRRKRKKEHMDQAQEQNRMPGSNCP